MAALSFSPRSRSRLEKSLARKRAGAVAKKPHASIKIYSARLREMQVGLISIKLERLFLGFKSNAKGLKRNPRA
jgi:hypothetical protein